MKKGVISGRNVRRENVAMAQAADRAQRIYNARKQQAAFRAAPRRARSVEHKTFDVGGLTPIVMAADTDTPVATSANAYLAQGAALPASAIVLNQVPIGNSSTTRVGRKLTMNALHVRMQVQTSSGAAAAVGVNTATSVALVLIRTLNTGTTTMPPQNTVFNSQNSLTLTNINNAQRFKVLRRWDFQPIGDDNLAGDRTAASAFFIDEMVKLGGKETTFTQADTTGTFDDMEAGALCLYVRGAVPAATGGTSVHFIGRLYFSDN